MLETKKLFAAGLAMASLATTGCYDFDKAFEDCVAAGRCNVTECDPTRADPPDDSFQDTNCDGLDGTASAAFFVDPVDGRDNHPGTAEAPFKTLSHALQRASSEGKALYLAQGTYDESKLLLDKPVSLYGGYARVDGGWVRGEEHVTHLGGGSIGLTVSGLGEDAGVVIDHVRITSTAGLDAGEPSIGMRVLNSKGVRLRYVEILAGAGARGADGTSPAANNQNGLDGGVGQSTTAFGAIAEGGAAGTSPCGGLMGGKGGKGSPSQTTPATSGESGLPSTDGGSPGGPRNEPFCGSAMGCVFEGHPGEKGEDGANGDAGTDGPPGNATGHLSSDSWVPASGSPGVPGAPGAGGGGGGGGGHIVGGGSATSEGGGGGGGGGGGCPGAGATGGGGGGASIALMLIQGQVDLEFSLLRTADGGQGGAGGKGGNGSAGGLGGPGSKGPERASGLFRVTGGQGGPGGKGGTGGPGGHGGNGGGGPSVGIWCGPSSSFSQTNTVFTLGNPGQPGTGPGLKDSTGLKTEQYLCPNP